MAAPAPAITPAEADAYYADLERSGLAPLWRLQTQTREPRTTVVPHIWKWKDFYPRLLRAAEMMQLAAVQGEGAAERRVLTFVNPGMRADHAATNTLVASVQLIMPGEVAPAHRHSATAVRLMIQGQGAYTTVEGERASMEPGDLILTPNWVWHDHGNTSAEPIVWMDGLDRLLVQLLNAGFFDPYPTGSQEVTRPLDYSSRRYGSTSLRPVWEPVPTSREVSPQIAYRWQATAAALRSLAELGESGPFGEVGVTYVNPNTGGHALSTIGCSAYYLPHGSSTRARRHTGSGVYHVISGAGTSIVNGQSLPWQQGDFFVIPPWSWYEHSATAESFLFCMNDRPILEALGLLREEAAEAHHPV